MEGYIAEIRMFAGNFAPRNWAYCQGQILSIAQNTALFSLLGTTFGGNGQTTFGLPDLRSRIARGTGQGGGLTNVVLGEMSGTETVTLTINNMAQHTHTATVHCSNTATTTTPGGNLFGSLNLRVTAPAGVTANGSAYSNTADGTLMAPDAVTVGVSGSNQPFTVLNPYLGMNYIICLYGIYPSRN